MGEKRRLNNLKNKNQTPKKIKKESLFSKIVKWTICIGVGLFFLSIILKEPIVRAYGKRTTAIAVKKCIRKSRRRSTYEVMKYSFWVENNKYYGESGLDKFRTLGDTFSVKYLECYPDWNITLTEVSDDDD